MSSGLQGSISSSSLCRKRSPNLRGLDLPKLLRLRLEILDQVSLEGRPEAHDREIVRHLSASFDPFGTIHHRYRREVSFVQKFEILPRYRPLGNFEAISTYFISSPDGIQRSIRTHSLKLL